MPLYSIQQGVVHSGYFDSLADEIGPYPQGLIAGELVIICCIDRSINQLINSKMI